MTLLLLLLLLLLKRRRSLVLPDQGVRFHGIQSAGWMIEGVFCQADAAHGFPGRRHEF